MVVGSVEDCHKTCGHAALRTCACSHKPARTLQEITPAVLVSLVLCQSYSDELKNASHDDDDDEDDEDDVLRFLVHRLRSWRQDGRLVVG